MRPQPLPARLWSARGPGARSGELTPLFVQRYSGPVTSVEQTVHPFWELICARRGDGVLLSGARRWELGAHAVCLMPASVPHIEYSDSPMDLIWAGIAGAVLADTPVEGPARMVSRTLSDRMEQLWLLSQQRGSSIGAELDGLTRSLLGGFLRRHGQGARSEGGDLIDRAIAYIHEHAATPLSVETIARSMGCSVGHFHRLFRRRTGRTPVALLTDIRIQRAMRLLRESPMQVAEVAREVGYEDPLYFSRVFHRKTGLRPSQASRARGGGGSTVRSRSAFRS